WILLPDLTIDDHPTGKVGVCLTAAVDLIDHVVELAVERFIAKPLALTIDDDCVRLTDGLQRTTPQRPALLVLLARNDEAQRSDVGHSCDSRAHRTGEPEIRTVHGGEDHRAELELLTEGPVVILVSFVTADSEDNSPVGFDEQVFSTLRYAHANDP